MEKHSKNPSRKEHKNDGAIGKKSVAKPTTQKGKELNDGPIRKIPSSSMG